MFSVLSRPLIFNYHPSCFEIGIYEFTFEDGSKAKGRYSFVYTFENGEWKISNHHSSIMPEPAVAAFKKVAELEKPFSSTLLQKPVVDDVKDGSSGESATATAPIDMILDKSTEFKAVPVVNENANVNINVAAAAVATDISKAAVVPIVGNVEDSALLLDQTNTKPTVAVSVAAEIELKGEEA